MMKTNLKRLFLLILSVLLCVSLPTSYVLAQEADETVPDVFAPVADGSLLLEVTDLSKTTVNSETGVAYTPSLGNAPDGFYSYEEETGLMTTRAVGGNAQTATCGGATNLKLDGTSKYTVTYRATFSTVASGGLRISWKSNGNSVGFYSLEASGCMPWGVNTAPGYSGYQNYTIDMKTKGTVFCDGGYAKFDIEINGYVISLYVNDVFFLREDIRNPSNPNAKDGIAKDFMSDTLSLVWHEYLAADKEAGQKSTCVKDLKVYSGLLHQEIYDLSVIGMQENSVAGVRNVRFVAGGISSGYAAAGFEIVAIQGDNQIPFAYETAQVLRKLTAPQEEPAFAVLNAEEENVEFLFAYSILGIPSDVSLRFVVRPYVLRQGTRLYGLEQTFSVGPRSLVFDENGEPITASFGEFGF